MFLPTKLSGFRSYVKDKSSKRYHRNTALREDSAPMIKSTKDNRTRFNQNTESFHKHHRVATHPKAICNFVSVSHLKSPLQIHSMGRKLHGPFALWFMEYSTVWVAGRYGNCVIGLTKRNPCCYYTMKGSPR